MFMKNNVTITVDASTVNKMREYYKDNIHPNDGEYVDFEARINGIIIMIERTLLWEVKKKLEMMWWSL